MKNPSAPQRLEQQIIRLLDVKSPARRPRRIPVAMRVILGLITVISAGTLTLWLVPGLTVNRISFMDALFTATSAATVTGLTVLTTSTDFTLAGQLVLLLLIQLGGVGYMFAAVLTLRLLGRRVSLLDRLALSSSLGLDTPAAILKLLKRVLIGIVLIEGVGAALLYLHWRSSGIVPAEKALLYAIFHAVSAFCNAGLDLFTGLPQYPRGIPGDDWSLIIMGLLIVIGGLGIPVLSDLVNWKGRKRFALHTRITLVVAGLLTLIGWVGLLIPEIQPGGVLHETPWDVRLVHTWFQSVSARTAGFPGLDDFNGLGPASRLLIMTLMFVGSAPASMGGGITTGAFAVLWLGLISYARGLNRAVVGGRTLPEGTVRRAGAVLTVSLLVVVVATWLILSTHNLTFNVALFEVVSAFATCGLSLGATGELNTFGRLVIIVMMFWGRLGALTIVLALLQQQHSRLQLLHYPEETVLIG